MCVGAGVTGFRASGVGRLIRKVTTKGNGVAITPLCLLYMYMKDLPWPIVAHEEESILVSIFSSFKFSTSESSTAYGICPSPHHLHTESDTHVSMGHV